MTIPEKTQPDIIVFTSAVIFSSWKERWPDFVQWMQSFKAYIGNSIKENPKMKAIYFSGPYLHSPTNDKKFDEIGRAHV